MFKPTTKFLIVDDFSNMRKIIKKTLSDLGFSNTVEAVDGQAAYDLLVEHSKSTEPIEFIISDWNMPKMPGIEFLKKCRADKAFEAIPFILVTVENDQSKIIEAVQAGVTDYLIKFFSPAMLKNKFQTFHQKITSSGGNAK